MITPYRDSSVEPVLCVLQVATEGDAFTMAFHDPIDAIAWALNVQHRLLLLPWPAELLDHPECTKQSSGDGTGPAIFCGLRVRMAIHTGRPDSIQVWVTQHTAHCIKQLLGTHSLVVTLCCVW